MTSDATKARDEHLIAAMAVILTSGYAIENHRGDARIEREDGQFRVLTLEHPDRGLARPIREHFDDVNEAIRYYLDACDDS